MRVVPNLYPAFERQEVVVHTPHHARSLADLSDEELKLVALAWHERNEAGFADGLGYLHVLVNEGREAGASLPHTHSQLIWMREPPPVVVAENARLQEDDCALCALLTREVADGARVIAEQDGVVSLASYAGRLPYELLIAPREHWPMGPDGGVFLERTLSLLADAIRRLHAVEGPVPWNAWLHDGAHWHLEVLPRIAVLAGVELGAGLYINSLPPEDAAEALRGVEVS